MQFAYSAALAAVLFNTLIAKYLF